MVCSYRYIIDIPYIYIHITYPCILHVYIYIYIYPYNSFFGDKFRRMVKCLNVEDYTTVVAESPTKCPGNPVFRSRPNIRNSAKEERLCTRCQLAEGAAAKPSQGCSDSREFEAGRSAKCVSTTTVTCGRSKVAVKFDAAFGRISMLRMLKGERWKP